MVVAARGDPCTCKHGTSCKLFTEQKGWMKCRPCAKGNHDGVACGQFKPEAEYSRMLTCRVCGLGKDAHGR